MAAPDVFHERSVLVRQWEDSTKSKLLRELRLDNEGDDIADSFKASGQRGTLLLGSGLTGVSIPVPFDIFRHVELYADGAFTVNLPSSNSVACSTGSDGKGYFSASLGSAATSITLDNDEGADITVEYLISGYQSPL